MNENFPWNTLQTWYHQNGRHHLLWRNYTDFSEKNTLYRIWLSEILLQQTQAERVSIFFEKILQKYPNIDDLAKSHYEEFFPYYQGLGYYSRARNILKTAKIIAENFSGIFPDDKKTLKSLPGIGEYTSHAILAFGYGKPLLAWDTNLEKVFSRYLFGNASQKLTPEEKNILEKDFKKFIKELPEKDKKSYVRNINNGLMDFSRIVDKKNPEKIDWKNYPFKQSKFYETRGKNEKNFVKIRGNFPTPDAKILVILHENHKKYFSPNAEEYYPFLLPPAENRNIREGVKDFFRKKYGLEISVRPTHKKWFSLS